MSFSQNSETKQNKTGRRWLGFTLALLLAAGAFFSGLQLGQVRADNTVNIKNQTANLFGGFFGFGASDQIGAAKEHKADMAEFWKVWNLLDKKFAKASTSDQLTTEEKIQGAIEGLVKAYKDPYTVYFPPAEAQEFDENISGNFSGVGMEVGMRDGVVTVIAPLPDTPAEKAGVLPGDAIVKIDDKSTDGMSLDEAVKLIRGEKGTKVVLQVYRKGETELIDIPIIRDNIDIPTVKTEQVDDVFIISLYSFNAVAESKVRDAFKEYLKSGAEKLIFDLRGNPGGFLQGAVGIASYFLPAGKVVVKESFNDPSKDQVLRSYGKRIGNFNPKNTVVLIDGGSASASEILAGALQDHKVATLIGTKSFGKGSVQELVELDDGSSLKVTIARWLTPNGTSISKTGLTPDIIINRTPKQRLAGEDPQRDAAIRFLHGEKVESETLSDKLSKTKDDGQSE